MTDELTLKHNAGPGYALLINTYKKKTCMVIIPNECVKTGGCLNQSGCVTLIIPTPTTTNKDIITMRWEI